MAEITKCPCCSKRSNATVHLRSGRDGFLISKVCPACLTRITSQAQVLRNMATVIAYGLQINPDGGEVMIGKHNYRITRKEIEHEVDKRDGDEDVATSYCAEEKAVTTEIEIDDSPCFIDEEDFDKWRDEYRKEKR